MSTMSNEELVQEIRAGRDMRENLLRLWEQNKELIFSFCQKYRNYTEVEDLLQESYFAFDRAVKSYDPEAGQFSTYLCIWLKQVILRYLKMSGNVRIPGYLHQPLKRYKTFLTEYKERFGRHPSELETCKELKCTHDALRTIRAALAAYKTQKSLDEPLRSSDDEDMVVSDVVPAPGDLAEETTDRLFWEQRSQAIWRAVDGLPEHQVAAIRLRFWEEMTYGEIGHTLGIEEKTAAVSCQGGLRNLRRGENAKELRRFWIEQNPYRRTGTQSFNRTWTSSTERAALRELAQGENRV